MKISELPEIVKEAKQRFNQFIITFNDEEFILFFKNSEIKIQFIHPALIQVDIPDSLSGIETPTGLLPHGSEPLDTCFCK